MRKFTSFLVLMLLGFVSISAQETYNNKVIEVKGDQVVALEELVDGGTYVLFNNGRNAYIYERADNALYQSANCEEGSDASYVFTFEISSASDTEVKANIRSAYGRYLPDVSGYQALSTQASPATYTITMPEDGVFHFTMPSGKELNGNGNGTNGDGATVASWISGDGANGKFTIYMVEVGDPQAWMVLDQVLAEIQFDGSNYQADIPGGYPQDLIDACQNAYDLACDIQADYGAYSDEEITQAADDLRAAYEALLAGQIPVSFQAGNYYLVSARIGTSNNMMDNLDDLSNVDAAYADLSSSTALWSEAFDATVLGANAEPQYIWKFEAAGTTEDEKPLYTIKNLAIDQYLNNTTGASTAYGFTASAEEAGKFVVGTSTAVAGFITIVNSAITTEHSGLHSATSGKKVVNWTPAAGGSAWTVVAVDDETIAQMGTKIDSLRNAAAQKALNDTLQKYYTAAVAAREAGRTFTFEGTNDGQFPVGEGLLIDETQVWVYPADPDENNTPGLFDGVFNGTTTFIHTSWHASVQGTEPHYIQMDLGEEVSTLVLKYAVRSDAGTPDIPYTVTLYGTNDANLLSTDEDTIPSSEWTNLGDYTLNWQYPLLDADGNTVSVSMRGNIRGLIPEGEGAGVTSFEFPAAYRYVRMAVNSTVQSVKNGSTRTNGDGFNYWCMAELRAYAATYDPDCVYAHMDEAAINALESSLATAKTELADEKATQGTIDALKAAYEAFMAVFPDKNKLNAAIAEAKTWSKNAVEGEEIGNYKAGALTAFNTAVNDAQSVADGTLTFEAYNNAMQNLSNAVETLAGKLVLPETGYYNIQSLTTGAAKDAYLCARYTSTTDRSAVSGLGWNYAGKNPGDYLNTLWYVEKTESGAYTFKNVASGYYMQNTQTTLSGAVAQGTEPCEIDLRAARDSAGIGLNFIINAEEGLYGNAQPGGNVFVVWSSAQGNDNSAFSFVPADYGQMMTIDLNKPVSVNVLPFTAVPYGDCYSVAGITEDGTSVALNAISGEIPAGTPFVIVADTSVTKNVQLMLLATTPDDVSYVYEPLTVNGLVGTFEPDTISETELVMKADCSELVYASSAALKAIAPNSGYFVWSDLQALPRVSAGDQLLPLMEDLVNGIGTLVAEPAAGKRQGVFTLQGQKITDTRNLPAGVYIVNGRKVLVK